MDIEKNRLQILQATSSRDSEMENINRGGRDRIKSTDALLIAYGIEDFDFHHKNATGNSIMESRIDNTKL